VQIKESSDDKLPGAEGRLGVTEETYAFALTYAQREDWVLDDSIRPEKSRVIISDGDDLAW
jgi:hypothetical protein